MKTYNLTFTHTILIGILISLFACKPDKSRKETKDEKIRKEQPVIAAVDSSFPHYGLRLNKYFDKIDTFKVRRNSVFSNLFDDYKTADSLLFEAIGIADSLYPINRIIAGKPVHMVYRTVKRKKRASNLVYHINETDKLILGFKDSAYAFIHKTPLDTVRRSIYAHINQYPVSQHS